MPRPPLDQRITKEEFKSYVHDGLVAEHSFRRFPVNGQRAGEFCWIVSDKTSPAVRQAVVDYLSAAAFGDNYQHGAVINERTREVSLIVYGTNINKFLENNFELQVRGRQ